MGHFVHIDPSAGNGDFMTGRSIAFVEFLPCGGLFQFTVQLGEALAQRGHDVHLFTGPRPELEAKHPRFTIHAVLPTWHLDTTVRNTLWRKARRAVRAIRLITAWLLLIAQLRRLRPDVVLWSAWQFSVDALGVLLTSRLLPWATLGIISHEPHLVRRADTTRRQSGPLLDRVLPSAWSQMNVVFVLGEQARQRVLESWQPAGPVIVIPHGDERALRNGQEVLPVADTGPVVLFFGTWTAYKGINILLDSLPEVRRVVPGARVILAGGVAGVNLPALLRRIAKVGGVDARPGYVPLNGIPQLFSQARVVVIPYLRASQSGVVHLAYTYERPVVATTVGDIPSVVRHDETGLLVPPGNSTALAKAVASLLEDPVRAQKLGQAGGQWLAAEASWERVAEQVEQGLDNADHRRPGRR